MADTLGERVGDTIGYRATRTRIVRARAAKVGPKASSPECAVDSALDGIACGFRRVHDAACTRISGRTVTRSAAVAGIADETAGDVGHHRCRHRCRPAGETCTVWRLAAYLPGHSCLCRTVPPEMLHSARWHRATSSTAMQLRQVLDDTTGDVLAFLPGRGDPGA